MSVLIKKRNFKPYVLNWLVHKLGLASAVGNVFYLAESGGAMESMLKVNGIPDSEIYHTLYAAEDATTTNQNDVILACEGTYTETAEVDWDKSHTHLVGLTSANVQGRSNLASAGTTPEMPGVVFSTSTASVDAVLHVTGHRNQFHGIQLVNAGANAANLRALHLGACGAASNNGYGNYFKSCNFMGIMDATYHNTIPHASITIGSGASYYMFEDCIIGQNTYGGARATAYQGHLNYEGVYATGGAQAAGYGPQNGIFKGCMFLSRGTTTTCVAVRVGGGSGSPTGDEAMDRVHWFIDCVFDNWYGAGTTAMTSVFDDNCLSWHEVRLVNCASYGYDQWRAVRASQNASGLGMYFGNMPVSNAAHQGEGVEPTS